MSERMRGVVKFFNGGKGYGFIKRDDGQGEVFVHASALPDAIDELGEGDTVSFELAEGRKGKKAVNVQLER